MAVPDALRTRSGERAEGLSPHDLQSLYLDDVFRYVSAFVRPPAEAEDVTMEVFHAAFSNLRRLRRADDPRLWLLGIARRKVADSLRKHYRRREEPLDPSLKRAHDDLDQSVVVSQVLTQLPPDQRDALILKYVNGLSIEEAAAVLGRSAAAANSLIQRARQSFYDKGASHFLSPDGGSR